MISSMTAYAQREINTSLGNITWEISSVNHRYLEIFFYIPEQFRNLEPIIRERIRGRLTRGKIDCSMRFKPTHIINEELILNEKLAQQIINAAYWVMQYNSKMAINPIDILRWPGVISVNEQKFGTINTDILVSFERMLEDFIAARAAEGLELKKIIEKRLKKITIEVAKIREYIPEIRQWQRKRLITKLKEAKIQLENNRLEQELLLMAQRMDIDEELNRIETHVKETFSILNKKTGGKHLDFIMQELTRESNTLAAKSNNIRTTSSAIELKILIEQIREQVQNIE